MEPKLTETQKKFRASIREIEQEGQHQRNSLGDWGGGHEDVHGGKPFQRPPACREWEWIFPCTIIGLALLVLVVIYCLSRSNIKTHAQKQGASPGLAFMTKQRQPSAKPKIYTNKPRPQTHVSMPQAPPLEEQETSTTAERVFQLASPSVVVVKSMNGISGFQGSGVVVGQYVVATNRHVVQGRETYVIYRGRKYPASIRYIDPDYDICALAVPGLPARPAIMVSYKTLRQGQRVYSIGAPGGLDLTVADGLISALRPQTGPFPLIQTNAPISHGSSGGGLFNTSGQLVGITTATIVGMQQVNLAIVADLVSLLPQRNVSTYTPLPQNPSSARDIVEKPWEAALRQRKARISESKQRYNACVAMLNRQVASLQNQINLLDTKMKGLSASGRIAQRNALVPEYNNLARQSRQLNGKCSAYLKQINDAVKDYNWAVGQYQQQH